MSQERPGPARPTAAFIGASWVALGLGMLLYLIGLWNANMQLNEKGFYLAVFLFGLFAAVSLQKAVRDRAENIPVTNLYLGITWFALIAALTLLAVGLWNAELLLSEKGFYGIGFALSLFAVVAVQKNVRDVAAFDAAYPAPVAEEDPDPHRFGGIADGFTEPR
ncbi:MAG: inner membrane protein YiaA [Microbacterium sp.]